MINTSSDSLNKSLLFLNLINNDIKNIFRDKTLRFLVVIPLIFILILRFVIPFLNELVPLLVSYNRTIFSFFCLVTAVFPSFIVSMVLIDERDEDVLSVFRVTPLSSFAFVIYRLSFVYLFSFIFNVVMFYSTNIIHTSFVNVFVACILLSLISPVTALTVMGFARNKIEAVTLFKGLNLIVSLPMLAVLFDFKFEGLLGIIPVYWTFQLIDKIDVSNIFLNWFLPGVFIHFIFIVFLYQRFRKKVF